MVPDSLPIPALGASSQVASAKPAQASREKPHEPTVLEMRHMSLEYKGLYTHRCMEFTALEASGTVIQPPQQMVFAYTKWPVTQIE